MKEWSNVVFAKNLKHYMDINGVNQKELAKIVGVSAPTVNEWLKAKKYPRIDKIEKLAMTFGILKSDLIEDKATQPLRDFTESLAPLQEAIDKAMTPIKDIGGRYANENKRKKNLTLAHEELIQMIENIPGDKVEWILSVMKSILADE